MFKEIPQNKTERYKEFRVKIEKIYVNKYIICLTNDIRFDLSEKIPYVIYDSKTYKKFCKILDHWDLIQDKFFKIVKLSINNIEYSILHYPNNEWIEKNYDIIRRKSKKMIKSKKLQSAQNAAIRKKDKRQNSEVCTYSISLDMYENMTIEERLKYKLKNTIDAYYREFLVNLNLYISKYSAFLRVFDMYKLKF